MQASVQPRYPLLYSLRGFRYCDLLLTGPERAAWQVVLFPERLPLSVSHGLENADHVKACRDIEQRANQTLAWVTQTNWPLDIALDNLTLGRMALYQELLTINSNGPEHPAKHAEHPYYTAARKYISAAVNGFRRAGTMDFLPYGLLSRAWLYFIGGQAEAARADLDEVWQITERGPMRLFVADIHLYRARLFHNERPYPWDSAHTDLTTARQLIEQCGYWRRKQELEDAEYAALSW